MFIPFWIVQLGAYICVFIAGAVVMFVTGILINKRQEAKRKARVDALYGELGAKMVEDDAAVREN